MDQFWSANERAASEIELIEDALVIELGLNTNRRLPVFFWNKKMDGDARDFTAFTSNLVNGVRLGSKFLAPDSYVLSPSGSMENDDDLFKAEAVDALVGYAAKFAHVWYGWHTNGGEVHCATEVMREPVLDQVPEWWK